MKIVEITPKFNGDDTLDYSNLRILRQHWPGVEEELKRRQRVQKIHRLGVDVLYRLLGELSPLPSIEMTVERYASLDADVVHALGGDELPTLPVHEVMA